MTDQPVLVTGATGTQGGAVCAALLARRVPVRALVRNPGAPASQALAAAGVQIAVGVAGVLARAWNRPIEAVSLAPDAAVAAGCMAPVVRSQAWSNEVSYGVDIAALRGWGLPLTSFANWARRHAPAGAA